MRDAVNLAVKFSMVLEGHGQNSSLLETYTQERVLHIRALTDITVELGKIIGETDLKCALALATGGCARSWIAVAVETVRQNMISGLDRGLVYRGETGRDAGAGTLAVQPTVEGPSGPVLLDEIIGPNFAILSRRAGVGGADGF